MEAIEVGLAPDGGLYVPDDWAGIGDPDPRLGRAVADTAAWVAPRALSGLLSDSAMASVGRDALDFPIPLVALDDRISLLELFHGPTLAFKDVGARLLARIWSHAAGGTPRTVLVATSGDTGGAVAAACHGVEGLSVAVLFPAGRVSELQRRQFTTLGGNVIAIAVDGPFDRCQALVKEVLADRRLVESLGLTTANSINIGRLLPQVIYYVHLARLQGWRGAGGEGPVIVPSGNLGNVTAGVLARMAGAPLGRLVAACNANDALPRYLEDGETEERPVQRTLSTAMDVGGPSNLERLRALFADHASLRAGLEAQTVSDEETRDTIRWAWTDHRMLLDPHTAVGVAVARRDRFAGERVTVLATAHPAKFPEAVAEASGSPAPSHPRLERNRTLAENVVPLTGGVDGVVEILERGFLTRDPLLP